MNLRKTDDMELEKLLKETLESDIIKALANKTNIDLRKAMDIYYNSTLSRQVEAGLFGMQYLSSEYLADDIIENEPELLK